MGLPMRRSWWALGAACAVAGCGARSLLPDDGPTPRRDGAASTAEPMDDAGPAEAGLQFYICPFSPPPADSACDGPGQTCVYEDLPSCPSIVCRSGRWQAGPEGC
jgi:hypothetical protein